MSYFNTWHPKPQGTTVIHNTPVMVGVRPVLQAKKKLTTREEGGAENNSKKKTKVVEDIHNGCKSLLDQTFRVSEKFPNVKTTSNYLFQQFYKPRS